MKNKIEKIVVSTGVFYIVIKEIDLRILCGAPADVVKLLTKKNIIIEEEKDGVVFETGPNAILLSDLTVQNSAFSNLSEFPVLQMFYRQGMILPNHPNNTGVKPILIGDKKVVDSQLEYIFRGNYGLISKEEIMATGVDEELAEEMMRIKLRFAFGCIKKPDELLQRTYVDNTNLKTELRDEAFIQRTSLNKFEITYKDEIIDVDLNLGKHQIYDVPYNLGYHNIPKNYFSVIHSGQGDGWSVNNPSMSSILMFQGKIYLIDAGPNIDYVLQSLGIGLNEIAGIFHTHAHDDHFAGLTSLLRTDKKLKYYSTRLVRESVTKKLSALLDINESQFENYFEVHDLEFDKWNNIKGLEVKPFFSPHPVETNIFQFRTYWNCGFKKYSHFADIASFKILESMVTEDKNEYGISPDFLEKVKTNYLKPATIKKVDIGGGMIHGDIVDFKDDITEKIILAHTSHEYYTTIQKSIGSGASFGAIDVMIDTEQDFLRDFAKDYLRNIFPDVHEEYLNLLMNSEIKTYNPHTIILKKDQKNDYVHLLLTGIVETLSCDAEVLRCDLARASDIYAGSFMGSTSIIFDRESKITFRTLSYVKTLAIPRDLFLYFINKVEKKDDLFDKVVKRSLIEKFDVFSQNISPLLQDRLTPHMHIETHPCGNEISIEKGYLYLICVGEVNRMCEKRVVNTIEEEGFFGEEHILDDIEHSREFKYIATEHTNIYKVHKDYIKDIPIVYWKMYIQHQKNR